MDCPNCTNQCPHSDHAAPEQKKRNLVLVGNMNVGKSSLFRRLCRDITTVQFPGTSVIIKRGLLQGTSSTLYLTPGICSLFSSDEDESVSRNILLPISDLPPADGIILVADAKNIKRSMAIAYQYAEYGIPMLLAVNMIDEASSRGIRIDYARLNAHLNITTCKTIAKEGIGITALLGKIESMTRPIPQITYPDWIESFLVKITELLPGSAVSPRAIGLLLLAQDQGVEAYIRRCHGEDLLASILKLTRSSRQTDAETFRILVGNLYNLKAEQAAREILEVEPPTRNPFLVTLGDWCTQLRTGIPIAIAMIAAMYLFVGSFAATFVVDTINSTIFEGFLIPVSEKLVNPIPIPFIRDMIIDSDFGILPTGVFLALGLVLPVFFCFYIAFGFLQDSGYLPRLSILLDKIMQQMGLNGKGVIPLVMGFSCVTMAILTTRILGSEKEKNIATFLLLLGMPCAPLIAVMFIILGRMPLSASLAVFGIIGAQIFIVGYVLNKILPGAKSPFLMEIPPLRVPKFSRVVGMATRKTLFFMKEAVPVFILASMMVFVFQRLGGLDILEQMTRPLITTMMGLPEKSVQVFIKTLIRRESGATELEHLREVYTNRQLVVNLLVMTFLTPCMNAIFVLIKERGLRTAGVIVGSVLVYAIIIGTLVNHSCRILGITFAG